MHPLGTSLGDPTPLPNSTSSIQIRCDLGSRGQGHGATKVTTSNFDPIFRALAAVRSRSKLVWRCPSRPATPIRCPSTVGPAPRKLCPKNEKQGAQSGEAFEHFILNGFCSNSRYVCFDEYYNRNKHRSGIGPSERSPPRPQSQIFKLHKTTTLARHTGRAVHATPLARTQTCSRAQGLFNEVLHDRPAIRVAEGG